MIPGIVAHLWQSTLFAGIAWLLTLALRKNAAQVRYRIWFIASVKFLIPFSLLVGLGVLVPWRVATPPIPTGWLAEAEQVAEPLATLPVVAERATITGHGDTRNHFVAAALALWVCGFAVIAICWLLRWKRVHQLRRSAIPISVEFPVPAMSAHGVFEPGIFGVFRPVLLLPQGIEEHLDAAQLDAILAHEVCHVRRRDNLTAAIHMGVQAMFWFHPLVWWLGARLVDERERACDEEVLRLGSTPQVYAAGILSVCKLYVESPLACVSGVTGADLKKRIEAIMKNRVARRLEFGRKAMLAVAATAALAVPVVVGIVNVSAIGAQSSSAISRPNERFEVASVKPSAPVPPNGGVYFGPPRGGPGTSDPEAITWSYATLKAILLTAYNVKSYQLNGPAWLNTERYDIVARVPAGATKEQVSGMWQNLLAERFGVVLHHESREFQVEELVVDKGGSKLKETNWDPASPLPPGPPQRDNSGGLASPGQVVMIHPVENGLSLHIVAKAQTISQLAGTLGNSLNRPVLDKTGLTGSYDYTLDYTSDQVGPPPPPGSPGNGPGAAAASSSASEPGADIGGAVQRQLGLRLVANKATIDVVIIDKAEKTPSAN